tara:strand:+ start:1061 stop:1261 length:201 start_codon:yes stop_codon:yes gene_type:complete
LSGVEHKMMGWDEFALSEDRHFTSIPEAFAKWCEKKHHDNKHTKNYTTFQDAIDALESFIKRGIEA